MRGKLLVPARSATAIVGVWAEAQSHTLVAPDGTRYVVNVPAGLITKGKCSVLSA